jgi:hypothetical protein
VQVQKHVLSRLVAVVTEEVGSPGVGHYGACNKIFEKMSLFSVLLQPLQVQHSAKATRLPSLYVSLVLTPFR